MPRCSPSSVIINITSVFVYSQRKEESVIDFTEKPICTVIRVMLEFSPYPPSFSLNSSVKNSSTCYTFDDDPWLSSRTTYFQTLSSSARTLPDGYHRA
jgi:hypothetical protein